MGKTAFVTGATGFVGLNLVEHLCEQGWHVIALHRAQSDLSGLDRLPKVERVIGDVTDARSLSAVVPRGVDCVFHAAGNTSLWSKSHVEQLKVNVRGTRNVVRAALEARAKRFIHTSSIVAYGLHSGVITEETPTRGSAVGINYVRSKALSEREVRKGLSAGLKAVIVNPSNILGRYDTASWSRLFRLVKQGRLPAVPPGGGSFCHATEVARALVVAAEQGKVGQNYLLGGAQASYVGLVKAISDSLGLKRRVVAVHPRILTAYAQIEEWIAPLFGREPDVTVDAVELLSQNLYCSSRLAERELGYQPRKLDEMIVDCRDWMRAEHLL
ncbi:SDR family NAD(P)-dependent oxidoreductase [Sinimarinibacterium sp. CAU 1509]|uniref:SDR family NAD(P)-dependent oxidoreductase n=1 Tax=Sinimarinibacterium sp. CAU 1509 TaxID=2562283 RepID=UPI00146A5BC6|nr:SDR family NAD(P)-dependent oxidoreductase [Sinimarinibacterium sp. CAU 1509]